MLRDYRKPLIMAAPKGLLRLPSCQSSLSEMKPGSSFMSVIGDRNANPSSVDKVIFVFGKHFYTLTKEIESRKLTNVAVIRIEELCPFPSEDIRNELAKYSKATEFIWSQEEHRNQGGWLFAAARFSNILGIKLRYAGREVHATPAVGVGEVHLQECKDILDAALL